MAATTRTPFGIAKKLVLTVAVLSLGGALITGGAFALFTATGTGTVKVSSGAVAMTLTGTDEASFTFRDIAPGDTIQRPLTITLPKSDPDSDTADKGNIGDLVAQVRFGFGNGTDVAGKDPAGIDPSGSLLAGYSAAALLPAPQPKASNGMTFAIDTCSVAWTDPITDGAGYTCDGTAHRESASLVSGIPLSYTPSRFGLADTATFATTADAVQLHSLITFALPVTAGNGFQNAALTIDLTATALQRSGIQK